MCTLFLFIVSFYQNFQWVTSRTFHSLLKSAIVYPPSLYMMKVSIHNNYEGRWQHPELTGQRFGTKSVTSQFKHSPTSTPEHPSSWITGGCQSPLLEKYWRGRDLNPGLMDRSEQSRWIDDLLWLVTLMNSPLPLADENLAGRPPSRHIRRPPGHVFICNW